MLKKYLSERRQGRHYQVDDENLSTHSINFIIVKKEKERRIRYSYVIIIIQVSEFIILMLMKRK